MTKAQEKLFEKAGNAIIVLKNFYEFQIADGESDATKLLQTAIKTFEELLKECTLLVEGPQEISEETISEILEATSKIIKQRILDRNF